MSANVRSRGWCYTLNNFTPIEYADYKDIKCRYHVMGVEEGKEKGTPHIQGFIYFKNAKAFTRMKKLMPRAHLENLKGTPEQAAKYCKKDGNYEEFGEPPTTSQKLQDRIARNLLLRDTFFNQLVASGQITVKEVRALRNARNDLKLEGTPYAHDSCRGIWYHGAPGVGKSRKAREDYPGAYIKSQSKWWDGYAGEEAVILDDLDSTCLSHYLKIWMDRYPCSGEVKGGMTQLRHHVFVVTSNYSPEELFKEQPMVGKAIRRRCNVVHMENPFTRGWS